MFRDILRNRSSYVTAMLTIAVAIGAVVAMFSVYSAVVLNPVDVRDAQELVAIQATNPKIPVPTALSWVRFDASLRESRSFERIGAYDVDSASFTSGDQPSEQLRVLRVSNDFFSVLGASPHLGRLFSAADDQPNGPDVCVLSHELWQTRFGGAPMLGHALQINGRAVEVIGILPPRFTAPWSDRQLFLPRIFETTAVTADDIRNGASFLDVVARLKAGVGIEQAQAELNGLARQYASQFAGRRDSANETTAVPFTETLIGDRRQILLVLLAAVGAVLLVACANASTLFLGRLLERHRETAVRQALGASRWRVVREFLLESLALSVVSGVAGLAAAWGLLRGVVTVFGPSLPQGADFSIDGSALGVALAIVIPLPYWSGSFRPST